MIYNHKFDNSSGDYGMRIFEQEPCRRTICINDQYLNFNFPYIYFVVKYEIIENEFINHGIFGASLQVYCSFEKVQSMQDQVYLLPYETSYQGVICVDHEFDGKRFKNIESLENLIISFWWQANHYLMTDALNLKLNIKDIKLVPDSRFNYIQAIRKLTSFIDCINNSTYAAKRMSSNYGRNININNVLLPVSAKLIGEK